MIKGLLCGFCFLAVSGSFAGAEVQLDKIHWQIVNSSAKTTTPIENLLLQPGQHLSGRLVAKLSLLNRGSTAKGILLRYSLAGRLAPLDSTQEGSWALPFLLEDRRVPKVDANKYHHVSLDPSALLRLYLKKVYREGYWPQELRLQVMLEPRRGQKGPLQIIESSLPLRK